MMKPLIFITNDDGYQSKGIRALISVARDVGDVVVMAPLCNASGLAHSLTGGRPIRVDNISEADGIRIYACDGTPVDCVKLGVEYFCPRRPDLLLSGVNHGSNASINIVYSGTMGAVIEATLMGIPSVGFSLLNHSPEADFEPLKPYMCQIVDRVMDHGLPGGVALNVNFPEHAEGSLKGVKVCRQSMARWLDSYEKRVDPHGRPYYWLTGRFECDDNGEGTDQWALENGYVSVVPTSTDSTAYDSLGLIKSIFE